jgi:two-component system, chemotaxis family, sensor kinase CheA
MTELQGSHRQEISELLEKIASSVVLADVADRSALLELLELLEVLAKTLRELGATQRREEVLPVWKLVRALLDGTVEDPAAALGQARSLTSDLVDDFSAAPVAAPKPSEVAEVSATPLPPAAVGPTWDEDTIELMGDFLLESDEGLTECDTVLLALEQDSSGSDGIDKLFRAFHTIKGTAGFLALSDISLLAHRTESLLSKVREKELELVGSVLDVVFDSVEVMRHHLTAAKNAMESRGGLERLAGLGRQVDRLDASMRGEPLPEVELPEVEPPMPLLGEIMQEAGAIEEEALVAALVRQANTGKRIGEELLRARDVRPVDVAQALRSQKATANARTKTKETIRVDLDRVDSLVEMIGELVIAEAMVANAPEITQLSSPRVRNLLGQLSKISRDLQSVGMRMRMVPLRGTFQKAARIARDVSHQAGKRVRVVTSGEATEMDRSMVERIGDPLVHIIRNAVDHGIEPTAERAAAGKPTTGVVHVSAYHESGNVVIEIADDGAGLDRDAILAKALSKGLVKKGQKLSDPDVFQLIFAAGFSTAQEVTQISGRGVGMDVVRRSVEAMRGRVSIASVPGSGTTFKLVLPLTLAIIDGMLVTCGDERYILPTLSIVESLQPTPEMLGTAVNGHEFVKLRDQVLPLFRLGRLLEVYGAERDTSDSLIVIVEGVGRKVGLLVGEVVAQQQVVIKSLGDEIGRSRFISGAAVLSDGRVGVILDVDELARAATAPH